MPALPDAARADAVRVPPADRWFGALFGRWPQLGRALARLETRTALAEGPLPPIDRPVYVCGMARSGSTLLLEILHGVPGFTAHHYSDYPFLWTPLWWNRLRQRLPQQAGVPQERAHGDRLAVTRDSPEAFEEVFWQNGFPGRHDPQVSQVLEGQDRNPAFDAFYAAHIQKLLAARGAQRYLCKANYHLTRLGYLHSLFPEARFVIPVREPAAQVESLLRQDQRFSRIVQRNPAVGKHLRRVGHREFGPDRRAVNVGDTAQARSIQADFDAGHGVRAYARQWAALHGWLAARLAADDELARACLLVPYAALCARPLSALAGVLAHAGATAEAPEVALRRAPPISAPDYYKSSLGAAESALIESETEVAWQALRTRFPIVSM
jgi:hypothetical protein